MPIRCTMVETERLNQIRRVSRIQNPNPFFDPPFEIEADLSLGRCTLPGLLSGSLSSILIRVSALLSEPIGLGCPYLYRIPDGVDAKGYCGGISTELSYECPVWQLLKLDEPSSVLVTQLLLSTPLQS